MKLTLLSKPISNHEDDQHLELVLCKVGGVHPFVIWTHNKETDDFGNGRYFEDLERAVVLFKSLGVEGSGRGLK